MKRFRFKLQVVLEQRQLREDNLLAELAEIRREEAAQIARLRDMEAQLDLARDALAKALSGSASPGDLGRKDEYAKAMRDDVQLQKLTLAAVRERVEAKRMEVVEAMKERQVLEALRDKQEQEYLSAAARAEQNEFDTMSSVRYARGM